MHAAARNIASDTLGAVYGMPAEAQPAEIADDNNLHCDKHMTSSTWSGKATRSDLYTLLIAVDGDLPLLLQWRNLCDSKLDLTCL